MKNDYLDSVTGIYPHLDDAYRIARQLMDVGLPKEQIQVVAARPPADIGQEEDSKEVLKNVVVDGTVGTAIGAGVGALGEIALVAANVSLFVASPIMAPLAMIGWGAVVGGFIGAARGISNHERQFSDLVNDAVERGYAVLVVHTCTEDEATTTRSIIGTSMQTHELKELADK